MLIEAMQEDLEERVKVFEETPERRARSEEECSEIAELADFI